MSIDVRLVDPNTKEAVEVERHNEGGTYTMGGTTAADLNITGNYSPWYVHIDAKKGLRWVHGKTGQKTAKRLALAVDGIVTDKRACVCDPERGHGDPTAGLGWGGYWHPEKAHALAPIRIMSDWATRFPNAVWEVW